ncbi:MAG: diadenylate cyclase CdaA [Flammeovirgaceae bacterium]
MSIGFLEIHWLDVLDIALVTILLYNLYKLIRGSVALKIFLGFLAVYLVFLIVKATEMALLAEILGQFMGVGVIAVIVLFQNEIKKFLLIIGKTTEFNQVMGKFVNTNKSEKEIMDISPILAAMKVMGGTNTGALIVVSRMDDLQYYAETGDHLDAEISKRLILSIFYKNSPLHDGAVIIHKNRMKAARCILPVSDNQYIPASMGLRHRAAVGITEVTSAAVLLVSEETGQLSFVFKGKIGHNLSIQEIRKLLVAYLKGENLDQDDTLKLQEMAHEESLP